MTAARRSEEALHGRNCRTMWAVIHRTDGGRLLFARKADLPRRDAAISGSAGWYCRSLASLPPSPAQPARRRIGACPVVGARPAAIRRSNAACPRHGDRRRNPRPTGRVCKVLELSGARVESFALQTAFVCVLIEHVSPHGGIDFLTHQLSTSVGGRCDLVQDHAESGLPTTTGCLSGLRRRTGSTGRWHHRGRACLTRPSSKSFKKENNSVHMDSSKSGIR